MKTKNNKDNNTNYKQRTGAKKDKYLTDQQGNDSKNDKRTYDFFSFFISSIISFFLLIYPSACKQYEFFKFIDNKINNYLIYIITIITGIIIIMLKDKSICKIKNINKITKELVEGFFFGLFSCILYFIIKQITQ